MRRTDTQEEATRGQRLGERSRLGPRPHEDGAGRMLPGHRERERSPADPWVSASQPPGLRESKCLLFKPPSAWSLGAAALGGRYTNQFLFLMQPVSGTLRLEPCMD